MSILQITPPSEQEQRESGQYALEFPRPPGPPAEYRPVMLGETNDELSRSRTQEAVWISLVVHALLAILIITSPKWFPDDKKAIVILSAEDLIREQEKTFLALPPTEQNIPVKPKSDVISDQDRIATSKTPQLDRRTLEELRDNRREGLPGTMSRVTPPVPPSPPPGAGTQQQSAQQQGAPEPSQAPTPEQIARNTGPILQAPDLNPKPQPKGGSIAAAMSASSSLQQAAQAAALQQGMQGIGGEMGLGRGASSAKIRGDMEITTDTQGVDFGPYLARLREIVMRNWEVLIPESARDPLYKRGSLLLNFVIMPDGRVKGMRLEASSGDTSLDRAAWGSITASDPFPPLPAAFHGPYLGLRCRFLYNESRKQME